MKNRHITFVLLLITASTSFSFKNMTPDKSFFDTVFESIEISFINSINASGISLSSNSSLSASSEKVKHSSLTSKIVNLNYLSKSRLDISPTNPVASAFAIQPSCTNNVIGSDGYLQLSSVTDGNRFHWSTGNTFDDMSGANTYVTATDTTGMSFPIQFATGQTNPSGSRDYTIRVYNGNDACFTDIVVTMQEQDCALGCECTDNLYLNDAALDEVHKFKINSTDGSLTEIGSPWLAAGTIISPHGVTINLNGDVYIGEALSISDGNITGDIHKLTCDGTVVDDNVFNSNITYHFNYAARDGLLYMPSNVDDDIILYDLCTATEVGRMSIGGSGDVGSWGFYIDDTHWYFPDKLSGDIFSGLLDPSLYDASGTNAGTALISTPGASALFQFGSMGLTRDAAGNYYSVRNRTTGSNSVVEIHKYDASGNLITSISDNTNSTNTIDGQSGFWGARGIVYNEDTNLLYVSSQDNCITVFDTSLVEQVALNIGNPAGGFAKGIGVVSECCPTNNNINIDTTLCAASIGDVLFLQELINCEGAICEGLWQDDLGNYGVIYDPCDNSITIDSTVACGKFILESDGTGANAQCGAFKIEVNIKVAPQPEATVFAIQPSCTDGTPNNDGYLQISEITSGRYFNWSMGSTYTGSTDIVDAMDTTGMSFPIQFATGQANPSGAQDYTIRVFSESTACGGVCFTDYTVTMNEQDCAVGCDCTEFIYLNETTNNNEAVHKYLVDTNLAITLLDTEIGSPWFEAAAEGFENPHGVGVDINGNIYIGEHGQANFEIRKLTCDGQVFPETEFGFTTGGQTNIMSYNGYIYYNSRDNGTLGDFVQVDPCTGLKVGSVDFCFAPFGGTTAGESGFDWGFHIDPRTDTMYATTGWGTGRADRIFKFHPDDFDNDPMTCLAAMTMIDPLPSNHSRIAGITTDVDGNMYVVTQNNPAARVLKYSPSGELLATSLVDNSQNGSGYANAIGIVYSEAANRLYVSTLSTSDDCVALFDTDLNYLGAEVPAPGGGVSAKGIGITKECCPTNNNQVIDTTLCDVSGGEILFLSELIQCEGAICEGLWQDNPSNYGVIYNPCDNSITIDSTIACGKFILESDGTGANAQCGAFKIEVNISATEVTAPVIAGDQTICQGEDPDAFTVTSAATGKTLTYQWQSSTTDCSSDFSDIASANGATYDPPAGLMDTTYYRVIATSANAECSTGTCPDTSNCVIVTVNPNPTANAFATDVTCPNTTPNADGSITLTGFAAGERFDFNTGNTYSGSATFAAGSTAIPVDGIIVDNLPNPSGSQVYTIRIFNSNECYVDRMVTLNEVDCTTVFDYPDYNSALRSCADEPCHTVTTDLYLGLSVSTDTNPVTGETADGDDDDGLSINSNMQFTPGNTVRIPVTIYNDTGNPAFLRMWIDWNANGDFEDAGEQVENNSYPSTGAANLVFVPVTIPVDAIQTSAIALRTRLSTDDTNSADPCGNGNCAADGEVEDYLIQIDCPTPVCPPVQLSIKSGNP